MEIKIGKYIIKSDPCNLWIEMECKGTKRAAYTKRVAGYSSNLDQLYESFCDRAIRDSDAESVKEFLADLKVIRKEIIEIAKGVKNE